MRQFGRHYRLVLGSADDGLVIEDLRVAFDFRKSIDSKPNPGVIHIWNLNPQHVGLLQSGIYRQAWFWAGYGELRLLYAGDILKAELRREELDNILSLTCGSGDRDYHEARVNCTLPAGADDRQAVEQALAGMRDTRPGAVVLPHRRRLPRSRVLCGLGRDVLERVAAEQGADWSIQNGELLLLPAGTVLDDEAVLLSQETGLIGPPKEAGDDLELTCLIDPAPRVGGRVRLQSIHQRYNGDYKILRVDCRGDVLDKDWFCTLLVQRGDYQPAQGGASHG